MGKRQRASTDNKGPSLRKRTKKSLKEPSTQGSEDAQQYWRVETVLDERKRPGKAIEYKVLWAPNSQTGETYPPSWEPASHLTADLLEEYRHKKSGDQADGAFPASQAAFEPSGGDSSLEAGATTTTPNRSARRTLALTETGESSPAAASPTSTAPSSPRPNQSQLVDPVNPERRASENGDFNNSAPAGTFAGVVLDNISDFPRDEYLAGLSQLQTSQAWPSSQAAQELQTTPGVLVSSQPSAQPAGTKTPKIIPDSQSQSNIFLAAGSPIASLFSSPELQQKVR